MIQYLQLVTGIFKGFIVIIEVLTKLKIALMNIASRAWKEEPFW